jgi:hypothetical protein
MKRTVMVAAAVLVLTMAGGAWAAGQITGKSIKDGSVSGKDIKNHSITKTDLKGNFRGPRGAQGLQGPQGPQGAQGPAGASGAAGFTVVAAESDDTGSAFAVCPAGTRPLSGGGIEAGDGYLWASGMAVDPDTGETGWVAAGNDTSPVSAFAYCSSAVQRVTLPNGTQGRGGRGMLDVNKVRAATRNR